MHRRLLVRLAPLLLWLSLPQPASADETPDEQLLKQAGVAADGPGLLEFFRARIINTADEKKLQSLVRQLGDDSYPVREEASKKLTALGPRARPALTAALKDGDPEIARRAEECLKTIEEEGAKAGTLAAAVRVLAVRKPEGAVSTLLTYLPFAENEYVAAEVCKALEQVGVQEGKADPALIEALADRLAVKRAAVGVALARGRVSDQLPAVRKLLRDADLNVRLQVAEALVVSREREAVPELIALTTEPSLTTAQALRIEEFLCRLAEEKAPPLCLGADAAARRKYHDAWKAWWDAEGAKLPATRLEEAAKLRGHTLIVLLDLGRVADLDATNRVRWQVDELDFPLDAQYLPGERVLVAEHEGNRVTERNSRNEILWEKKVGQPLMAQRLPNGDTFIGTRSQVLEVDPSGKEVYHWAPPNGEQIMKAQKLPNGDVAVVTQAGAGFGVRNFVRVNARGEELQRFFIDLRTSGGRIDVLANGHVLAPEKDSNRVAEYDGHGNVVWEAVFEQPVAAVRLPNGNTLVTSFNQNRAVELDPQGKEIWQYRSNTRVTRAFRR
jgi:HEAT repeat protein